MPITDIYYEHMEEAAFLYDQRKNILSEPDGNLAYQSQIEERLEAHIDALELGGEHSKPILKKYLDSEDLGEFFTAVYSLMRMGEAEQNVVMEIFETYPIPSPAVLYDVFQFLNSNKLNERLTGWLTSDSPPQKAAAAETLGYKRYSNALPLLEKLLTDKDIKVKTAAMKAINRLDPKLAGKTAYTSLIEDNSGLNEEAYSEPDQKQCFDAYIDVCFENFFIQGEKIVFRIARQYCKGKYPFHSTAPILLGLNADTSDIHLLVDMLKAGNIHRSVFQAIGFTGRIDILEKLIAFEEHAKCNLPIQEAAHLILGTDPPDYGEEQEEGEEKNKQPFSLDAALLSTNIRKSDKYKPHRLGKLISKENEKEIFFSIGAIYRRWIYMDRHNKSGEGRGLEYDDLAKRQFRALQSI